MSQLTPYVKDQFNSALDRIHQSIYIIVAPLRIEAWHTREPVPFAERRTGKKMILEVGDKWGNLFDCAWFRFTGKVPSVADGKHVVLLIDVSGEMLVVDQKGIPVRGLTNVSSEFDFSLGKPGKRIVPIARRARSGQTIDVWADAGCNDLFGNHRNDGTIRQASIAVCDKETRALYYDYEVLLDLLNILPENTVRYQQVMRCLHDAARAITHGCSSAAVADARRLLKPALLKRGGDASLSVSAIGHAHIDLGWLWPIRETYRKGARTFATVVTQMEKYPEYHFGSSQPQLYEWIKEQQPELYAKIMGLAKQGRFETQGAMWVECDTNVTGAESLVRQMLIGKRFFRKEFGIDVRSLWLPDAFGYSAALPQIMKRCGVDYFMTIKLSWNNINKFPYHSFHWKGVDGTTVLAHMLPEETYNSSAAPRAINKAEKNYKQAAVSGNCLMLFGIGDGGGGPGEEHLERLARVKDLAGLCPVKQEPSADFFERWAKDADRFPEWSGELYLERHQGTLTTEAKNKWYNRKMEQALREWELWASLASRLLNKNYPADRLNVIWKEILLYQFHDILPGSSIKRVYDECLARYEILLKEAHDNIRANQEMLAKGLAGSGMKKACIAFNSLSWARNEWVFTGAEWKKISVPSMGYSLFDASAVENQPMPAMTATKTMLENDRLRVKFNQDGSLQSIYDKGNDREVLMHGQRANRLAVYQDNGDAWDFAMDYAEHKARYMVLASVKLRIDGPRAIIEQTYRLGDSELVQEVILTAGSRRLDFVSRLHWREPASMLRTSFPVAVQATDATFEIQFGNIKRTNNRNTTWDLAKDEVPAQKWADLSQRDYGVALLNDSKYGHKVKDNVMDLCLLRSVPYPRPPLEAARKHRPGDPCYGYTDQDDHVFTYSLYPHTGDHVTGGVIQAGYELNHPLGIIPCPKGNGKMQAMHSFMQVGSDNIIIEAVKKAEDDDGIIVRLYEATGASTRTELQANLPVLRASETDLMEEKGRMIRIKGNVIPLSFQPFEIKTVKLELRSK